METVTNMDIREWALMEGLKVGERGRLPKPLLKQYLAAHPHYAREVAQVKGIQVPTKGKLSAKAIAQILELKAPDAKP